MAQTIQVKLTLPKKIKDYYDTKAKEFDMQSSSFIKYLLMKHMEEDTLPTYHVSKYAEMYIARGLEEYKTGKLKKFTTHKDFIKSLSEN